MGSEQVVVVFAGALAGGIVNGLTGFGTALTVLGIWLYAITHDRRGDAGDPVLGRFATADAADDLAHDPVAPGADFRRAGHPRRADRDIFCCRHIDPRLFRIGVGGFLVIYSAYVLARRAEIKSVWGGQAADGVVGFVGGVLGGIAGLSGVLPMVWTDVRGWTKEQRRAVVQTFNIAILSFALVSHAVSGLLTRQVAVAAIAALPGTIGGAWFGAFIYRRLADRSYQRIIMMLLLLSGIVLIWTSL